MSDLSMPYCPCCEHESPFLPFGVQPRPVAMCQHCRSLERHRLLWLFLTRRIDLFENPIRLLHFAIDGLVLDQLTPGTGRPYDVDAATDRLVRRLVEHHR